MSRPLGGDVISFCKGPEAIDPSRMRISLGKAKPSLQPKQWPTVEAPPKEVVVEMSAPREEEGLQGWAIPAGYTLFGMALAVCNLLSLPVASQVCSAACPLPVCCLLAHGLALAAFGQRGLGLCLALAAWLLPLVCSLWSLAYAAPLAVFLAGVQAAVAWHWAGGLCLLGLAGSLALAFLGPAHGLEARWGTTLALFFLIVLCVLASLRLTRAAFRVKCVVT